MWTVKHGVTKPEVYKCEEIPNFECFYLILSCSAGSNMQNKTKSKKLTMECKAEQWGSTTSQIRRMSR